jgi:superfamily I DNA/RNA helicase
MKTTQQQEQILEAIKQYKTIKINAFAGSGKTTILKLISQKYKNKKILYLAFNSAIKNEASGLFPNNTFVKTTHGLAFSAIKKYTKIDLNNLVNYRAIDISKQFEITYNQAIGAIKIFDNFCNTTRKEIDTKDTEHTIAKKIFDMMLISKMKPTHSFYLKYYYLMLSSGQIQQFNYDIIMLDEAQDTNEVTLGIFEALDAKVKIFVGDQHQQIYSFRGSKNILNQIKVEKELYLSCSFRFNNTIAKYANILLRNFKNEKVTIDTIQNDKDNNIITSGYISRTNAQLISIISQRIKDRKPFVTIREPNEIFNLTIEVLHFLQENKKQIKRNRFLKDFADEDELLEYAKEVEDYELKSALKIAKEYKNDIFEFKIYADKFYKAWANKQHNQFYKRIQEILFLTTAHTAKGLEWDSVTIADDFTDFAELIVDFGCDSLKQFQTEQSHLANQELLDEFNLFYVAITRAKKELIKDSENFHYLMAKDINKLIDLKIKESKEELENIKNNTQDNKKTKKISKMHLEEKMLLRQQKNLEEGKAKNSGLKWSLEDRIKAKSMYKKGFSIIQIANKLERTQGSIEAELKKSGAISD